MAITVEDRVIQMEREFSRRISDLETEVLHLRQERASPSEREKSANKKPWWEEIRGIFKDDPAYAEAMRYGREYREAQKSKDHEDANP